MKSITNILRRSNITPFERVTALVHNDIQIEKTGKGSLSESDVYVLTKSWSPNSSEVNVYNKYIRIIKLESTMKMDTQMFLYGSEVSLLRNQRVVDSFISYTKKLKHTTDKSFENDINPEDCVKFLTKHTYLEYEKTLHIFTFHNLSKEIQKDLLLLDESVAIDNVYLEDQVFLYERFKNADTLRRQDKDLIVSRIYSRMYYEGIKKMKSSTEEKDGFLLHHFFAELSIKNVFEKITTDANLVLNESIDMEKSLLTAVAEYAKSKNMSMESIIKEKILLWLDDGLFTTEYVPLFLSDRFDTWNGNTKKNHKELFVAWYTELQKSKQFFQNLFDAGKIIKHTIEMDFLAMPRMVDILTGDSLYTCTEDIDFVKEYKQQIGILISVANTFLFVRKHATPNKNYRTLCELKNLSQKVSSIFDIDMTKQYTEFINSYQGEVDLLNYSLSRLVGMAREYLYTEESLLYVLSLDENCFIFSLDIDGDVADIAEKYREEFKKLEK